MCGPASMLEVLPKEISYQIEHFKLENETILQLNTISNHINYCINTYIVMATGIPKLL
uniref:Uncharacterized protein n=1 Tax=Arundo donax TaxID=35708 RepID=A0A0A9GZJ3_ARUDO